MIGISRTVQNVILRHGVAQQAEFLWGPPTWTGSEEQQFYQQNSFGIGWVGQIIIIPVSLLLYHKMPYNDTNLLFFICLLILQST